MSFSQYNQYHCEIVESGIDSMVSFYGMHGDDEKRSILLCLDRYLDPYYKNDLPHKSQIFKWLESEFQKTENIEIKEDIFELIDNYSDIEIQGYEINDDGYLVKIS